MAILSDEIMRLTAAVERYKERKALADNASPYITVSALDLEALLDGYEAEVTERDD